MLKKKKKCRFCQEKVIAIDYKNLNVIARHISEYKKIKPKYYTGVCLFHQKKLSVSIKNARIMGLLPFVPQVK